MWKATLVDKDVYCPHSLVVADVNGDKRPDILVGEMTCGGWNFPYNNHPKLYLYLNQGNLVFRKYMLHEGWGVHMMRQAPLTPGKVFVFAADEMQLRRFPDMTTHVVGWQIGPRP